MIEKKVTLTMEIRSFGCWWRLDAPGLDECSGHVRKSIKAAKTDWRRFCKSLGIDPERWVWE
jgi:hypothetical protein